MSRTPWHHHDLKDVLTQTEAAVTGLSTAEVERRLQRDGPNALAAAQSASWLRKLLLQFVEPLVVVLLAAAVLSVALKDYVDAAVIAAVVLVNAVIGFLQEHRAEQSIAALSRTLLTEATVLRDGVLQRVPSQGLVQGDVVALQSGDTVPADLRLLDIKDLHVEEAALTGESLPVAKKLGHLPEQTVIGDRHNLAFAGSAVTFGQARGLVVATGNRTEAGQIAHLMASTTALETPLTRRIAQLSRVLVWVTLAMTAVLFALQLSRGATLADTVAAAVAFAVGAIPEGLPAAVTILLAAGVSAMAARGAIIRRLPAVETLGSTTVICSDKTGTLTQNQMTVTEVWTPQASYGVTGSGYQAAGEFRLAGRPVEPAKAAALLEALRIGLLCNDTRLVSGPEGPKVEGDPTEAALLVAAAKAGLGASTLADWPRRDVVPFESAYMYMATLHQPAGSEAAIALVKGSSDALLSRCMSALANDGTTCLFERHEVEQHVEQMARQGLRVLVAARKLLPASQAALGHDDLHGLQFVALLGLIDPPRPEARAAVTACKSAGIAVKMITGDHAVTAAAIADALGLEGDRTGDGRLRAVTGTELAAVASDDLPHLADSVAVFARVAPEQKLALVQALQKRGHVVAMTGDGVNDAPALKQADIGVAMGKNGTDVARSAAAMILTDDNFATIANAVEEGRGVYANLVKFIAWTLPTNGGEGVVLLVAVALGTELPVLPVQLLWVNLATAILLGTSLIFEPREPGLMALPPRSSTAPILDRNLLVRTLLVSLMLGLAAFGFFAWARKLGMSAAQGRTLAINTIVVVEVGYLFACRSLRMPAWKLGFWRNQGMWLGVSAMLLAQLAFTYLPWMNRLFHTEPVAPIWWLYLTGVGVVVYVLAEAKKLLWQPAS